MEEAKIKYCVLMDCNRKAVGTCNNCGLPVCEVHSKRMGNVYLCINCFTYLKKAGLLNLKKFK